MTDVAAAPRRRSWAARAGWALFALVDAPVLGVVAIGLLAAYLPPRPFWWAQLVAIGLPYAVWPLAALAVVLLVGRRWGWGAVHLLLVTCVAVRAGVPGRFAAPAPGPNDLTVISFNIPTTGPSGEELADSVAAFVATTEPDLFLLQDALVSRRMGSPPPFLAVQVRSIVERHPYTLPPLEAIEGPPRVADDVEVPLLVRRGTDVEVLAQEALQTGASDDGDASHALRSHVRLGGREAVFYNVHLRSFGASKPWDDPVVSLTRPTTWIPYLRRYRTIYAERGAEADALAERIAAETLPVIVTGDFNSTADNWSYHRLRTAGGVGRVDAMQAVGGGRWGRTYHSARPFVRIDYVLADPALEVTSAAAPEVGFSDHRPVRVRLRWRSE